MKRIFVLSCITFIPLYAFGDYVPGRTRASAEATLVRVDGDGRYQKVQTAAALEWEMDGKGVTGFHLAIDRAPALPFAVASVTKNPCGHTYVAALAGGATSLKVEERDESCRKGDENPLWDITLVTRESSGTLSHLHLRGEAIPRVLTQ